MAEMRVAREKKAALSVHVLDISKGLPVGQVPVSLQKFENEEWRKINTRQAVRMLIAIVFLSPEACESNRIILSQPD